MTHTNTEVKAECIGMEGQGWLLGKRGGLRLSMRAEKDSPIWRGLKATWKADAEIPWWQPEVQAVADLQDK